MHYPLIPQCKLIFSFLIIIYNLDFVISEGENKLQYPRKSGRKKAEGKDSKNVTGVEQKGRKRQNWHRKEERKRALCIV